MRDVDPPPSTEAQSPQKAASVELKATVDAAFTYERSPALGVVPRSHRSALDGAELEPLQPVAWSMESWPGVAQSASGRFRLSRSMLDSLPDTIGLHRVDRGVRSQLATFLASEASDVQLTASGDALFLTVLGLWSVGAQTRVHQVQSTGREVMSCRLVDDDTVNPGWPLPLQLGGALGFNGRWLAVRTTAECPACDFWGPPRVVFFDLGRDSSPGLSPSGWVGPRGTPGGTSRAR